MSPSTLQLIPLSSMQFTKPNAWKQRIEPQVSHLLTKLPRQSLFTTIPFLTMNMTIAANPLLNHARHQALFLIPTIRTQLPVSNFKITLRRSPTKKYLLRLVKLHPRKNMNLIFHSNLQRVTSNASKIAVHRLFQCRLLIVIALPARHVLRRQTTLIGFEKIPQQHHQIIVVVLMDL